jgi:hypothetical protein
MGITTCLGGGTVSTGLPSVACFLVGRLNPRLNVLTIEKTPDESIPEKGEKGKRKLSYIDRNTFILYIKVS